MKLQIVPYPKKVELKNQKLITNVTVSDEVEEVFKEFFPSADGTKINFIENKKIKQQGYNLTIAEGGITICYADNLGKFYAAMTLSQIIKEHGKNLPCCIIEDYPTTILRSVQLCYGQFDVSYNAVWVNKFLKEMAEIKVNVVQLYLEWNFCFEDMPFMSKQKISALDMQDFVTQAKKYNIDIIPAVNILGHSSDLLSLEICQDMAESESALCPNNLKTMDMAIKIIDNLCKIFPFNIIHVGGDEVGAYGKCPKCKEVYDKKGKLGIFFEWFSKINEQLKSRGRKMGLWSDQILMLLDDCKFWIGTNQELEYREDNLKKLNELSSNLVVYDWWYEGASNNTIDFWVKNGIEFISCGASNGYITSSVDILQYKNQYNLYSYAQKQNCFGIMTTDWMSVNGIHAEHLSFLFASGACMAWSGCDDEFTENMTVKDFMQSYSLQRYGVKDNSLTNYLNFVGNFDSPLLSCLPSKCRGLALRNEVFFNHNPLSFYFDIFDIIEDLDVNLDTYFNKINEATNLYDTINTKNHNDKYFYFLRLPIILHTFIYKQIITIKKAMGIYKQAALLQFENNFEFIAKLQEVADVLNSHNVDFLELKKYCNRQAKFLGNDLDSLSRVNFKIKNWKMLVEFIRYLKNGTRTLPTFKNISSHLFGVCEDELYGVLTQDWCKKGAFQRFTSSKSFKKSYFCKDFSPEELIKIDKIKLE